MLSMGKNKQKPFFSALLDSPTGAWEIKLTKGKLMRGKKTVY